jgi:hypothetical protein
MSGSAPWCVYVAFAGTKIDTIKVPVSPSDSVRHLLIKVWMHSNAIVYLHTLSKPSRIQAKERARLNAFKPGTTIDAAKSSDMSRVEEADCLVEASGAVLFDGDFVNEVHD